MSGDPCKCGDTETWHPDCYKTIEISKEVAEEIKRLQNENQELRNYCGSDLCDLHDWMKQQVAQARTEEQVLLMRLWNLINSPYKHGSKWSTFKSKTIVDGLADLKQLMILRGF